MERGQTAHEKGGSAGRVHGSPFCALVNRSDARTNLSKKREGRERTWAAVTVKNVMPVMCRRRGG